MKKLLLCAMLSLFILGSGIEQLSWAGQATWPAEYRVKVTTRLYNTDYDKVFNIVVDTIEDNGYVVIIANKQNGVIVTDYQSDEDILQGRGRIKLDFNIRKIDENTTKLRLNIHCVASSRFHDAENLDNLIDEDNYQDFFDAIDKAINKK